MCKIVVLREMLGNREICWSLWDGKQVIEMTSKQIKDAIKSGNKIYGLGIDTEGNLALDTDNFYCTNVMEHRHCASYTPMYEEDGMGVANIFFIVTGARKDKAGNLVYDCISTKFERLTLSEVDLKAYLRIGVISGGCKLGKDGEIILASMSEQKPTEKVSAPKNSKAETNS